MHKNSKYCLCINPFNGLNLIACRAIGKVDICRGPPIVRGPPNYVMCLRGLLVLLIKKLFNYSRVNKITKKKNKKVAKLNSRFRDPLLRFYLGPPSSNGLKTAL